MSALVVAGTFLALGMWGFNHWLIDGGGGELLAAMLNEDIVYALVNPGLAARETS